VTLADYLNAINGEPWTEERNCWVAAAEIQQRFFGRSLPLVAYPPLGLTRHRLLASHPERLKWRPVDGPAHGSLVLMSKRRQPRIDEHAGVCLFVPSPMIVHSDRPHGVAVEDIMAVEARGWLPQFYEPL
jgi:hypothetical protein